MATISFYPELIKYLENIESRYAEIKKKRAETLEQISKYIGESLKDRGTADLVFICTHNSRRSQLAQAWATIAAEFYGIQGVGSFSGGTESTAFYPGAVAALERAGARIEKSLQIDKNHHYSIHPGDRSPGITMFSKKYDDPANPKASFCAIMVCSDADEACPFITGAEKRISLPYNDPKKFDATQKEEVKYDERCRDIAEEIFYVLSLVR